MAGTFGFRVWGARGSLPRLAPGQERHGGNTACIEVIHPGDQRVVIDAGTGIANYGDAVLEQEAGACDVHLFLSHYHWDHVMGLPFFGPLYRKGFTIHLYGQKSDEGHLEDMLHTVFSPAYSPIYSPENLLGNLSIPKAAPLHAVQELQVNTTFLPRIHPGGYLLIRVEHRGRSFAYASDVELRDPDVLDTFVAACQGVDTLVVNSALSDIRFRSFVGWGHSSLEAAADVAGRIGVRKMIGIHFDPMRLDDELDSALRAKRMDWPHMELDLAREGEEVWIL